MGLVQHEGGPCGVLATIQVIPRFLIMLFFSVFVSMFNQFLYYVYSMDKSSFFFLCYGNWNRGGVDAVPKWIVDHGIMLKK
jgi:hypothetical protein